MRDVHHFRFHVHDYEPKGGHRMSAVPTPEGWHPRRATNAEIKEALLKREWEQSIAREELADRLWNRYRVLHSQLQQLALDGLVEAGLVTPSEAKRIRARIEKRTSGGVR